MLRHGLHAWVAVPLHSGLNCETEGKTVMTSTGGNGIESYAMDEFDNPPKGPAGVHRGRRSAAARYTPFVVVVVVAALCGFLAWGVLSGEFNKVHWPWSPASSQTSGKTSTTTAKKKAAEKKAAAKKAAEKKQQEEAAKKQQEEAAAKQQQEDAEKQQQEQAAQVDRSLSVRVINGTGISGYAATKQSVLNQAGYANVAAANPSGTLPDATVVWYQNDADKATAEDVANALGISNVQQAAGLGASIVVILLS